MFPLKPQRDTTVHLVICSVLGHVLHCITKNPTISHACETVYMGSWAATQQWVPSREEVMLERKGNF